MQRRIVSDKMQVVNHRGTFVLLWKHLPVIERVFLPDSYCELEELWNFCSFALLLPGILALEGAWTHKVFKLSEASIYIILNRPSFEERLYSKLTRNLHNCLQSIFQMNRFNPCERVWAARSHAAAQPDAGRNNVVQVQIVHPVDFQGMKVETTGVKRRRWTSRVEVGGSKVMAGRSKMVAGRSQMVVGREGKNCEFLGAV